MLLAACKQPEAMHPQEQFGGMGPNLVLHDATYNHHDEDSCSSRAPVSRPDARFSMI